MNITLDWKTNLSTVKAYAIGDIRPVINSQAIKLNTLPSNITHGLGALSTVGPDGAGEGIVLRGWAGVTPPTKDAGTFFSYHDKLGEITTPFFLGWNGQPNAQGRFFIEGSATLRQIYETVFLKLLAQPDMQTASIIFLELVGLFPMSEIHDRTLKAPVHADGVIITSAEYASHYFKFKIIQEDLLANNYPTNHLVPLTIIGVGFNPKPKSPELNLFEQIVFYQPPQLNEPLENTQPATSIKTHSHAIGWRDQPVLREYLLNACKRSGWQEAFYKVDEIVLPNLLMSPPDYIVHIDEWSRVVGGIIRVFVLESPNNINFSRIL